MIIQNQDVKRNRVVVGHFLSEQNLSLSLRREGKEVESQLTTIYGTSFSNDKVFWTAMDCT